MLWYFIGYFITMIHFFFLKLKMQDWVSGLHLFSRTQMILTTESCFSKFLWIHGVLLYPLNYEEAESSSKAEDDQKQELPR